MMWSQGWRETIWSQIDQNWDVLIIGGGVTGAGILNLAAQCGLRALLVEANDFAFGTSSRSSKLVHGGIRYLRNKQWDVVQESVKERERLLREAPHLVDPLQFIFPVFESQPRAGKQMALGVLIYDLMAPKWNHRFLNRDLVSQICPLISTEHITGGQSYGDARVDDARLVLRLLREGVASGGTAINYTRAVQLLRTKDGQVCGAAVEDCAAGTAGRTAEVKARVVINATGPWTDELRSQINAPERIRKLRGSHLILSQNRLPIPCAITLFHPRDGRALFAIPWEGVTLIGTTDLDHTDPHNTRGSEPFIHPEETEYLLEAARHAFPSLELTTSDIISSFAGLRPIIHEKDESPSSASRKHVIWEEDGLLTITGGKLTIFRPMAAQTLLAAQKYLGRSLDINQRRPIFKSLPAQPQKTTISVDNWQRLAGRYGMEAPVMLATSKSEELSPIHGLPTLWAELRWAAREEGVAHLDDLLLRRTRLGMQLPLGGAQLLDPIRAMVQTELGWDDTRWNIEVNEYKRIWQQAYSPTPGLD